MQFLERPAFRDKPIREPIEQFGMGRPFAHASEVARGTNQALSEMVLPNAVHNDSSRQGILRAGNPLGEGQATQTGALRGREDRLLL